MQINSVCLLRSYDQLSHESYCHNLLYSSQVTIHSGLANKHTSDQTLFTALESESDVPRGLDHADCLFPLI